MLLTEMPLEATFTHPVIDLDAAFAVGTFAFAIKILCLEYRSIARDPAFLYQAWCAKGHGN